MVKVYWEDMTDVYIQVLKEVIIVVLGRKVCRPKGNDFYLLRVW